MGAPPQPPGKVPLFRRGGTKNRPSAVFSSPEQPHLCGEDVIEVCALASPLQKRGLLRCLRGGLLLRHVLRMSPRHHQEEPRSIGRHALVEHLKAWALSLALWAKSE